MEQEKETVKGRAIKIASELVTDYCLCTDLPETDECSGKDCVSCNERLFLDQAAIELKVEGKTTKRAAVERRAFENVSSILASDRVPCLISYGCSCERPGHTCTSSIKHFLLERAKEELAAEKSRRKGK